MIDNNQFKEITLSSINHMQKINNTIKELKTLVDVSKLWKKLGKPKKMPWQFAISKEGRSVLLSMEKSLSRLQIVKAAEKDLRSQQTKNKKLFEEHQRLLEQNRKSRRRGNQEKISFRNTTDVTLGSAKNNKQFMVNVEMKFDLIYDRKLGKTVKQETYENESFTESFTIKSPSKKLIRANIKRIVQNWESKKQAMGGMVRGTYNWWITGIKNVRISKIKDDNLFEQKMKNTKFSFALLGEVEKIDQNVGECVIDYLMYEISRVKDRRIPKFHRKKLIELFGGPNRIKNGISTREIIEFAKSSNYINVFAINPVLEVFTCYRSKLNTCLSLCFIVKDDHCYPVLSKKLKNEVMRKNKLDLGRYKYDITYKNHQFCEIADAVCGENVKNEIVLVDKRNLKNMAVDVMNVTKCNIEAMRLYYGSLTSFKHPKGYYVESAPEYQARKRVCEYLFENVLQLPEFEFKNQSWGQIALSIIKNKFSDPRRMESSFSEWLEEIYEKYPCSPYVARLSENCTEDDNSYGFDISKDYSSVLLNNEEPFPIFTGFDEVQSTEGLKEKEWVPGEYYVDKKIFMANGTIQLPRGFYPINIVKYCVFHRYIKLSDVKYFIPSSFHLEKDFFKEFVEFCYSHFPAEAKNLVNHFIGYLNKKYHVRENACLTDSFRNACATYWNEKELDRDCSIETIGNLHFVKTSTKTKLEKTNSPIWRQVICGGIINLDKLYKDVCDEKTEVVSYNTDSIFVRFPKSEVWDKVKSKEEAYIGDIRYEDWKPRGLLSKSIDRRDKYQLEVKDWSKQNYLDENLPELKKGSYKIDGMPGCGKSYLLHQIAKSDSRFRVVSLTNNAVDVQRKKFDNEEDKKKCKTIHSLLEDPVTKTFRFSYARDQLKDVNTIYVDEFTMTPAHVMELFLRIKKKMGINFRLFGDSNQCLSVEKSGKNYDYDRCRLVKELCDFRSYSMSYRENCGRYDKSLYDFIKEFLKTGKIPAYLEKRKISKTRFRNLCFSNKKRDEINQKCFRKFVKKHGEKVWSSGSKEWAEGVPIICIKNQYLKGFYNSQRFQIVDLDSDSVEIKREQDKKRFSLSTASLEEYFDLGFCVTVHKIQGGEIDQPYNIYEAHRMDKRLFYTTISRGITLDHVHFEYCGKTFYNKRIGLESINRKIKNTNSIGIIYQIKEGDRIVYVGSTTRDLKTRLKEHLEECNRLGDRFHKYLSKKSKKNFKIEEIKTYKCISSSELIAEELKTIKELSKVHDLLNKIGNKESKPQIEILQAVNINKKKINIVDKKNCFVIDFKDKGKHILKKRRYGKRKTKEEAFAEMLQVQKEILEEFNGKCEDVEVKKLKEKLDFSAVLEKQSQKKEDGLIVLSFDE